MSLESITDATARVFATVPGVKAAYASTAGGQGSTVQPIPQDISDTPVVICRHNGFELVPGSFERIRHTIVGELYVASASAGNAEKVALPIVTLAIAAMRVHVGLFGQNIVEAVLRRGGPPLPQNVNGKDYIVWPLFVEVLEATVQTYTL